MQLTVNKNYFITLLFILFYNFSYSKSLDSCKYNISINYNTRKFYSFDELYEKRGPFRNNRIRSATFNFNATFAQTKKYQFITSYGIIFRSYSVGYLSETKKLRETVGNITSKSWAIGIQNGIAVQRKIFKIKNTNIFLSGGFLFTGYLISDIKDETFKFERPNNPFLDSIVIYHDSHKQFYFNPMVTLNIQSKIKRKVLSYGIKLIKATELSDKLKIRYRVGSSNLPDYYQYIGFFEDYRNQWEFFLGFAF